MSAFTSVSARRVLAPPPSYAPPPPPITQTYTQPAAPAAPKAKAFSPAVRDYVQRCFASENKFANVSHDQMQAKLKVIISDAVAKNTIDTIDWAAAPLPQQVIQQELAYHHTVPQSPGLSRLHLGDSTHNATNPSPSKKRKSSDLAQEDDESALPPWRKQKTGNVLEDRISYASTKQARKAEKRQQKFQEDAGTLKSASKFNGDLEKRQNRFGDSLHSPSFSGRTASPTPEIPQGPLVGTCQDLEKRFFRLTSAPRPEAVRPLPVLQKALEFVVEKFKQDNNYNYLWDQFKSLRQDLTVQHIKNEFTVKVYETHARYALENADIGEYNACQAQLRTLHKQNLGGSPIEFLAYRILYYIVINNKTGMNEVLAELTPAERQADAVQHALQLRKAVALGNYHRFFQLYRDVPNLGGYIVDAFVERERLAALAKFSRTYKPHVDVPFVTAELAFESEIECCQFIAEHGGELLLDDGRQEGGNIKLATGRAGATFEHQKQAALRQAH